MDVTTIKLTQKTKSELDKLKADDESYDRIIKKLVQDAQRKELKEQLIEAYRKKAKEDLAILGEWEVASSELNE